MFVEAIQNRIRDYNSLTRIYKTRNDLCPNEMNKAIKSVIISITILMIVYLILFILAIYYSFKCVKMNGWNMWVSILLILAMFIPTYGGVITIGVVIYGMTFCGSVCDAPMNMMSKF